MEFDPTTFECPGDETLAVFAEGRLRGRARYALCAHLLDCAGCYAVFRTIVRDRTAAATPLRARVAPLG